MGERTRALGLHSGGLDGELAGRLLAEAGVEVEFVHFRSGFEREDRLTALARRAAAGGAPFRSIDIGAEFFDDVVLAPRLGRGAGMDACLDCRILMLRRAVEIAKEERFDLLFTGEVLGQRPRDQSRAALARTADLAGATDLLVRPLSACKLPPSPPEARGLIERRVLCGLHGRGRRGQLELAARLGVEAYPTPSGGCCKLADRGFARRLRDLLEHGTQIRPREVEIRRLDLGRHFRLAWNVKLVVGRNEEESAWLDRHLGTGARVQVSDGRGALAWMDGEPDRSSLELAGRVAVRYSRHRGRRRTRVIAAIGDERREWETEPATESLLARLRV